MTKLSTLEGIGPAFEAKLKTANVGSCEKLLELGASTTGRQEIAAASGIDYSRILKFVNHADLCRIKGIGGEYSELLEVAGIDSVPELAQRNAENLAKALEEVNINKNLVRSVPSKGRVASWVAQAKELPRVVTH